MHHPLRSFVERAVLMLLLFLLLATFPLRAQHLVLKNYNVKDGLPSSEVYCAFQDSRGFIWFGTDGGVTCFDGYVFKNYTTEDGLADNTVFGITEDKKHRLWFRSLSGKLCYWNNDSIYSLKANDTISSVIKNAVMISLYVDSGDTVWCGLRLSGGYFKIAPGYTARDFQCIKPTFFSGYYMMKIEDDHMITGHFLSNVKDLTFRFYSKEKLLAEVPKTDMTTSSVTYLQVSADTFLISDLDKLFLIRKNGSANLWNAREKFHEQIICLKKTGSVFWAGVHKNGVFRLNPSDGFKIQGAEKILEGYSVSDVLTDNEGGTWFTTLENGIFYASADPFVSHYSFLTGSENKMSPIAHNVLSISKGYNRIDLISGDTVLRDIQIPDDRAFEKILGRKKSATSAIIKTIDPVQTANFISYYWNGKTRHFVPIVYEHNTKILVLTSAIDTIFNRAYVTNRYDLFWIDSGSQSLKKLADVPARTLCLYTDPQGLLWLGCINGLWSYNGHAYTYHGNENAFLKHRIDDIKVGADGTWYFATRGNGVIVKKGNSYTSVTTRQGLPSNNCECLDIDERGDVWTGTKNGLCKLSRKGDGLFYVSKLNIESDIFSRDISEVEHIGNTLWISTSNGIATYVQPDEKKPKISPQIYLKLFSVNETDHLKDKIRLFDYNQNYIRISFVGLSYHSFGKVQYKYKLIGLDTVWHSTSNTTIQYPFLPPGDYRFVLKAIAFDGPESRETALISFSISKPFWFRTWFILLLSSVAGLMIYSIFYFRLRTIKTKERQKTQFNHQLATLEMRALRAQMNPHFIFNAINSIQNHIIRNDRTTAQDYLAKFARLIRNVLENSKSESISVFLELETLSLYIELEQIRVPGKFSYSIHVEPSVSQDNTFIPPLLLQPFVENCILHGLMPLAENNGKIDIRVQEKQGSLVCCITDNGIGRKKASEIKKRKASYHRSMGLSITEERINLLNRPDAPKASISVEDLEDRSGNPSGTRVILSIPLVQHPDTNPA